VAVGHQSPLIAAGLAATLTRTPGCDVRLSRISPSSWSSDCSHTSAQLIFGDAVLLHRLRTAKLPAVPCSLAKAKFVWVTVANQTAAQAAKAAGEIDEHVPLDCPEDQLFAVVRRLAGCDPSRTWHAAPAVKCGLAAPRGGLAPGALRRVRDYITEHLAEQLEAEILARIAALSLGHFNRAFKQSTGYSPHQYLVRERIAVATALLTATNRALVDIALEVGFADQSHFSRTFVAVTGETPSACRRRHR
jgi:AraC-like DNA-binding protein